MFFSDIRDFMDNHKFVEPEMKNFSTIESNTLQIINIMVTSMIINEMKFRKKILQIKTSLIILFDVKV